MNQKTKRLIEYITSNHYVATTLFRDEAFGLLEITEYCRPDMHEPDEQEIKAYVRGEYFDNAGVGAELNMTITNNDNSISMNAYTINLATLTALARIGASVLLEEMEKSRPELF